MVQGVVKCVVLALNLGFQILYVAMLSAGIAHVLSILLP